MSTTITTPIPPLFDEARLAVAGFLARYSGPTRRSYVSDLRQFFSWCASVDIETFAIKRSRRPHRALAGRVRPAPQDRHRLGHLGTRPHGAQCLCGPRSSRRPDGPCACLSLGTPRPAGV